MCISITFRCAQAHAANVESQFQDGATLHVKGHNCWREKHTETFSATDIRGCGCACGLLGEGASWKTDAWVFKESWLPALAETVGRFAKLFPGGFTFETQWNSEAPDKHFELTLREMQQTIKDNRVSTRASYRIRPA